MSPNKSPDKTISSTVADLLRKYNATRTCAVVKSGHRELIEALLEAGGQASTIMRIMSGEYKLKVNDQAISRHKRGDCTCAKK